LTKSVVTNYNFFNYTFISFGVANITVTGFNTWIGSINFARGQNVVRGR
jgi:hypothetical protein